jgi:hypothetical protein
MPAIIPKDIAAAETDILQFEAGLGAITGQSCSHRI